MNRGKTACLCTLVNIQNIVCKKWNVLLLVELYNHKSLRYLDMIKKFQGISPSTLTLMLKQLQEENLIERQVLDGSSTKITYTITSKGKKLLEIVLPLLEWIKSQKNQEIHDSFIECMS